MNQTVHQITSNRARLLAGVCGLGVCMLGGAGARAQEPVYSNGSTDPTNPGLSSGAATASGVAAPAGFEWSEVQAASALESNAVGGFSAHQLGGAVGSFRFADDFVVTGPMKLRLGGVELFAYQEGATAAVSPFVSATLRIWRGRPGDAGSTVAWGDTTSNRLTATTPTNLYRAFNTAVLPAVPPDASRLIWRCDLTTDNVLLEPGTYWLDWQIVCADPLSEAFCPPIVVAGQRTRPGANARQLQSLSVGATWVDAVDPGKPRKAVDAAQDLPFILLGTMTSGAMCLADIVSLGGDPPPDGLVTGDDFIAFINAFSGGDTLADIVSIGGEPPPDGLVTGDDFNAFVAAFAAGCP